MKYSYLLIFIIYVVTNNVLAQTDSSNEQEWPFNSDSPSVEEDNAKKERSSKDTNRPNPGQLITVSVEAEKPKGEEEKPETEELLPIEPITPVYPSNPIYSDDTPSQTVYSNPFIANEEMKIPTEPIQPLDDETIRDILRSSEIAETSMSYDTLKNSKDYVISVSGYLSPFYQEIKTRTWMLLNISGEFGWLLNDQLELGPFAQLDFKLSIDGVGTQLDHNSKMVVGGFAEYHFYKLSSMRRFFPSLGVKIGYAGIGGFTRNGILSQLYLDMVFFLSQGIGIKWDIGPALVLTFNRPDPIMQVDSRIGLVYYF